MNNRILVVGKKSFIAQNIKKYIKIKNDLISFEDFLKKKITFLKKYNYIINCSSNLHYVNKRYNLKYDFDLQIAYKIKNIDIRFFS